MGSGFESLFWVMSGRILSKDPLRTPRQVWRSRSATNRHSPHQYLSALVTITWTCKVRGLRLSRRLKDSSNAVGRILTRFEPISWWRTGKNQNRVTYKCRRARGARSKARSGFSAHLRTLFDARATGGPCYDGKREIFTKQVRYRDL